MPRIYTRRGDEGETSLLFGGRVSKNDPRCRAYGTVDEAVSALGLARSLAQREELRGLIKGVQRELFTLGAELATDEAGYPKLMERFSTVTPEMVERLEHHIDRLNGDISLPDAFIIPGGSPASGALDLARTILRRAERGAVALKEQGLLPNPYIVQYLNRLADLVFVMARYEDKDLPFETLTSESP